MKEAEPVIRAALPDANVPVSVRSSAAPVTHGSAAERDTVLDTWFTAHADRIASSSVVPRSGRRPGSVR